MEAILEPIIRSPRMPEYLRLLNELAEDEARRRREFVESLTPEQKAEFIDGEVILHSPARRRHLNVTGNIFSLLRQHVGTNRLGEVFVEKCLVSLSRNDYEPDIVFFRRETAAKFTEDQMRFPAPDLVVEVLSKSTEAFDRGVKFEDYAHHGVREYWIVDADAKSVEQYVLPEGERRFTLHERLAHSTLRSHVVEGFEVPIADLFETGDAGEDGG
ncbi:MAG: Uma2 family endonuclease [Verrucomicrobiales bacterium]